MVSRGAGHARHHRSLIDGTQLVRAVGEEVGDVGEDAADKCRWIARMMQQVARSTTH